MRTLFALLLLCSSAFGQDIFKPTGRYAVEPVKPIVVPSKKTTTSSVHISWNIKGDWSPTEAETRNHLINDHGQTSESLKDLSFQQLLNLHDSLHNRSKPISKSVSFNVSSSCPGGVCPSSNSFRSRKSRKSK
jgi:hypothetical protein